MRNQKANHSLLLLLAGAIFVSSVGSVRGAASPAALQAKPRALSPAEARADFDLMRAALEEAHTGLYRYSTRAEMDRAFDTGRAKLSRATGKLEFMTVIGETLAAIRCGHTSFQPDDETKSAFNSALKFPLRTLVEGNRLMVLFNDTPDDRTIRPGMEILEVNGHKVAALMARMRAIESADGDIESGKRLHIQGGFAMYYWFLIDQATEFTIKAKTTSGQLVTAHLTGVTDADRKKNHNPVNEATKSAVAKLNWSQDNQALRFLKDPEIAQIRLRYFVGNDFPQWLENTFKTLKEKGTKTLILDLRGNGGGEDMYGAMFVSYLTDHPFRYFDHINLKTLSPSFKEHCDWNTEGEAKLREETTPNPAGGYLVTAKLHPGIAEQSPGKHPFLGKVFILIDGGTFSTAADFCAVTHHLKRATFIGEETGGGYYGNNSGMQTILTLPNSKLRIRLPMSEYWNAVPGYAGKRRGTVPDYKVDTTIANLLLGVDSQLDLALKLATTGQSSK